MPKVIADITMSLDGYVTGPGADVEHGLGDAPELHAWVFGHDPVDAEILEGATAASGAVVMGRRLFDTVDVPGRLVEGHGLWRAASRDASVLRRHPLAAARRPPGAGARHAVHVRAQSLQTAIDQARAAATDGDVVIMGGGDVIGQALEMGIVDEFRVHLAPLVLGGGTPLFRAGTRQRYRQREVRPSSNAVHIAYERLIDE